MKNQESKKVPKTSFLALFSAKPLFVPFVPTKGSQKLSFFGNLSLALCAADDGNLFSRAGASGGFAVFCEPPPRVATARRSENCSIRAEDCEGLAVILRAFVG